MKEENGKLKDKVRALEEENKQILNKIGIK
jgi:hypothetical protein